MTGSYYVLPEYVAVHAFHSLDSVELESIRDQRVYGVNE
jgi:hypothetical protein